jgi:hypothetical protein
MRKIQNRVGALGMGFHMAVDQNWKSTGYPAEAPFNGELMWRCTAPTGTLDKQAGYEGYPGVSVGPATMGIGCNMTGGPSGGGWAINLDGGRPPLVASVNSYGYDRYPEAMYGPYQGTVARDLYNFVSNL